MFYRENGQFKTSYRADQQIFPIAQDRIAIGLLLVLAVIVVPLTAPEYLFRAVLIPFLILSLAALGLNILVGYCGQISLGTGAFMAVGAYAAYNFMVRVEGMPLLAALLLGGRDIDSLRRALRHPVAAHQGPLPRRRHAGGPVLHRLGLPAHHGSPTTRPPAPSRRWLEVFSACPIESRSRSTCSASPSSSLSLCSRRTSCAAHRPRVDGDPRHGRGRHGHRHPAGLRQATAFAVSCFIVGVAAALWAFVYLGSWEPARSRIDRRSSSFHGHHRRPRLRSWAASSAPPSSSWRTDRTRQRSSCSASSIDTAPRLAPDVHDPSCGPDHFFLIVEP
jgi:branched-chain amino acid transport system permease protein